MGSVVTVMVPAQHPAFEGHFPGAPLLPGVVLLDEMLRVVEEARGSGGVGADAAAGIAEAAVGAVARTDDVGGGAAVAGAAAGNATDTAGTAGAAASMGSNAGWAGAVGWTIGTAKFLQPVRPGDTLTFEHEALTNGAVRFAIRSAGRAVATGTLVPRLEATERGHGHQAG